VIQVRIESVANGGYGVARVDGLVHFIPETVTGDLAIIEPVSLKKRYTFSRLIRLIEPSPFRTDPFCPYFGDCGGCQLQHIGYETQLQIKQKMFLDQMARIGGFGDLATPKIVGSRAKRIRMRFQIDGGRIGLFQRRSHRLCPVACCPVSSPEVNNVLAKVSEWLSDLPGKSRWHGTMEILGMKQGRLTALGLPRKEGMKLYEALRETVQGAVIVHRGKRTVRGKRYLPLVIQGITLYAGADAFVQVNPEINGQIVGLICRFLSGSKVVYDLYGGCGNFALPLSRLCGRVTGVERDRRQVAAAELAVRRAGVGNISFVCADAAHVVLDDPDGVVLDPPRSGLSTGLIDKILAARPTKAAYVSCNPSTLARDLAIMVVGGYEINEIALFDMFPHTHHLESVTLLCRKT
ncbi:MAG: class I SAM-dependent RNA methyltransferase, partial [bacterium]|nr:class I SAM-dependent RNA methyltransferase [bacterium]